MATAPASVIMAAAAFSGAAAGEDDTSAGGGGLTLASLKHVKRQRDKLADERGKLLAELDSLRSKVQEERERGDRAEASLVEAAEREAALAAEAAKARETIEALEEEVARLKALLKGASEKAEESAGCKALQARLQQVEAENEELRGERTSLRRELLELSAELDRVRSAAAVAMAAAERSMAMHTQHVLVMEQLRAAKLEEAIKDKMELHISMPKVTLNYNNAPPLLVNAAAALSEEKVRSFLENQVFPHFEPMWVCLDGLAKAPDGSTKKDYATKMLDLISGAIKGFINKAQQTSDNASLAGGHSAAPTPSAGGGGGDNRQQVAAGRR